MEKSVSVNRKHPKFSMWLCLWTQRELTIANSGLKIVSLWGSDNENWLCFFFLEIRRLLGGTKYIRFLIYLKAVNGQKNEGIWFFHFLLVQARFLFKVLLKLTTLKNLWSIKQNPLVFKLFKVSLSIEKFYWRK